MSSVNSESFTSSPIWILLYLFILWFLWLELPKLCWIVVVRVDTFVFYLILEEMLSVFCHLGLCVRIMFVVGLSYMAIIMLRYVPSMLNFWRIFIINRYWFCQTSYASIEIIIWFLSFNFLVWCSTLIELQILKNPCIPGIKPTWSLCMIT